VIEDTNSNKAQMHQVLRNEKNRNRKGASKEVNAPSLIDPKNCGFKLI